MVTASQTLLDQKLSRSPGKIGMLVFGIVLVIGVGYAGQSLLHDLSGIHNESVLPYVLLGLALLVALGFEFVNGFHDTANAVATVIYTHSLEPHIAVVWSRYCRSNSLCKWAARRDLPWSSLCS
jgi:PiT family inorganic phosphate transporter